MDQHATVGPHVDRIHRRRRPDWLRRRSDAAASEPDPHRLHLARAVNTEIWVMNADGTEQKQLTFTTNNSGAPSWSPDGSRILFTRWWLVGAAVRSGVFRMKSDGSETTCPRQHSRCLLRLAALFA
jgi:Tol biopolymer transport system component